MIRTSVLAIIGLFTLVLSLILIFVLPGSRIVSYGLLGIGTVLIGVATALDIRRVRKAISSGKGKFGLGATLSVALFLGIVLLANAISVSQYHRFDLTGIEQFTLTSQTKQVLSDLRTEVEIISMFTPTVPFQIRSYAHDLLNEYKNYSDFLTVREIDPDIQPDEARKYGLDRTGAIVGAVIFRSGIGQRQILGPQISMEAEYAFTSALLEVSGVKQKHIYFLTGHDEQSIAQGYSNAAKGLKDNLFAVSAINLGLVGEVPEDAAAIIIAGPRLQLSASETELINRYIDDGGRMVFLLDPDPPDTFRSILEERWIEIDDGYIIDPASFVAPYRSNPLVTEDRNTFQFKDIFFSGVTAVIPSTERPEEIQLTPLAWTTREAWLEKGTVETDQATFDPDEDRKGPRAYGALVELAADAPEGNGQMTRIAVIGDSDFISNDNFQNGSNSTFFLSVVNWLTDDKAIISIDRKVLVTRRLILNPEQARFLNLSSIALLPLLLVVAAIIVWWRRKQS